VCSVWCVVGDCVGLCVVCVFCVWCVVCDCVCVVCGVVCVCLCVCVVWCVWCGVNRNRKSVFSHVLQRLAPNHSGGWGCFDFLYSFCLIQFSL